MKRQTRKNAATITEPQQRGNTPKSVTEPAASPQRATRTIKEAARILGIGVNQAYAAAHSGELPTIRMGGRILVPSAALEKILQAA